MYISVHLRTGVNFLTYYIAYICCLTTRQCTYFQVITGNSHARSNNQQEVHDFGPCFIVIQRVHVPHL